MPAVSPLRGAPELMAPSMLRPQTVNRKSSGEPKLRTTSRSTGREAKSTRAPNIPPSMDTVKAALRARAASPLRAMG